MISHSRVIDKIVGLRDLNLSMQQVLFIHVPFQLQPSNLQLIAKPRPPRAIICYVFSPVHVFI